MNQKTSLQTGLFPRLSLRAISLFTVIVFLCSDLLFFPTQALAQTRDPSNVRGGVDTSLLASASAASGNAQELVIPPGIGTVIEAYHGPRATGHERRGPESVDRGPWTVDRLVVLIQDAHSVPDAQRSLEKLIEYLQEKYGVSTVALEGAQGKLDPTLFRLFPDEKKRKEIFNAHLDSGELSGAAAASVLSSHKADYVGIEDWKLYQEGVQAFLAGLEKQAGINTQREALSAQLKALKEKYYSAEALDFDAKLSAWDHGQNNFSEFLNYLAKYDVPSTNNSVLGTLFKTLRQEKEGLDPILEDEIKTLARQLDQSIKDGPQRAQLNALKQASRTGHVSRAALAYELQKYFPEGQKISAELQQVMEDHRKLVAVKGPEFSKELEVFLDRVREKLFVTPEAKAVAALDSRLRLLEKLVRFELSRSEWEQIRATCHGPRVTKETRGVAQGPRDEMKDFEGFSIRMDELQNMIGVYFSFYEIAEKREAVFSKRIVALAEKGFSRSDARGRMDQERGPWSVARGTIVVTGGFHTPGLAVQLKEQGIPYAVVSPAIKEIPQDNRYFDQMQGKVSWQKYFRPKNGKVDLYDAFARATTEKLLGDRGQGIGDSKNLNPEPYTLNAKEWRDDIIRELAQEGRIADHARYTRYIDEVITGNSEEFETLKKKWTVQLEKFIEKLQALGKTHPITEANIANLLSQPANQTPYAAASLAPGNLLRVRDGDFGAIYASEKLPPKKILIPAPAQLNPKTPSEVMPAGEIASEAGARSEIRNEVSDLTLIAEGLSLALPHFLLSKAQSILTNASMLISNQDDPESIADIQKDLPKLESKIGILKGEDIFLFKTQDGKHFIWLGDEGFSRTILGSRRSVAPEAWAKFKQEFGLDLELEKMFAELERIRAAITASPLASADAQTIKTSIKTLSGIVYSASDRAGLFVSSRSELRGAWKKAAAIAVIAGAIAGAALLQDHFIKTFLTIFFVVNPIGSAVTFLSMTGALKDASERKMLSKRSLLAATGVGALFLFAGNLLFNFIGITLGTFMIAGGALLFTISLTSLTSSTTDRRLDPKEMGVVPLGIPLIVGPATLTTLMILRGQYGWPVVASAFLTNMLLTAVLFRYSEKVIKVLGKEGAKVIGKIFNLLLAALGVTLIAKGLITVFPGLHSDTIRPLTIPDKESPAIESVEKGSASVRSVPMPINFRKEIGAAQATINEKARAEVREDLAEDAAKRLMAAAALARQKDKEHFWGETALSPQALVAGLVASRRGWRPYQEAEHVLLEATKWVFNADPGEIPSSEEAWGLVLNNGTALELFTSVPSGSKRSEIRAQESHAAPDLEFALPHSEADNAKHAAGDLLIKINEILQTKLLKGYFSVFELARSTVQYGQGGVARVYAERGPDGAAARFKLVVEDQGPGLSDADPNIHFKNGEQFHSKRMKRPEGWLLSKIGRDAESAVIEYGGNRWERENLQDNRSVRFKKTGTSDVRTGMRTTLTFSLSSSRSEARENSSSSSSSSESSESTERVTGKSPAKDYEIEILKTLLPTLSPDVIARLRDKESIGAWKKILLEAGVSSEILEGVRGKFLYVTVKDFLDRIPKEGAKKVDNRLRRGNHGRYLAVYLNDDFDYIIKTYYDREKKRTVQIDWQDAFVYLARPRLKDIAVPTIILDATEGATKEFVYKREDGTFRKTDIAIIQQKVTPLYEYLYKLEQQGDFEAQKRVLEDFKKLVIEMFRRSVVDVDFGGILANYGVDEKTGKVYLFDFGDLSGGYEEAYGFADSTEVTNEYIVKGLETNVGDGIAAYFLKNGFKASDFEDPKTRKSYFGADLAKGENPAFAMNFPLSEEAIRALFANHEVREAPVRSEMRSSSSSSSSEDRKKRRPLRRSDGKESKWAIFDRFVQQVNTLRPEQVIEVDEIEQLSRKRQKLIEWGIEEADEVDGRYLVSAIQKIVEAKRDELPEEREVVWTDLLSYGGVGRYLIAYKDEDPEDGWVVKIANSEGNLRYIDLYALNGARIAQARLGGLAATLMIFDGRQNGKTFFFNTADRGPVRAPVAIVQEKLLPFVEYLKQIGRRGASGAEIRDAIGYVGKYKQFVIAMYRRGVVDIDNFNIVGNYGIRKSDQSVAVFDVGDLADSQRDAERFVAELKDFNETITESLEEIDGVFLDPRISDYFKKNPFRRDDFIKDGKDLFGSEYDPQKSRMVFPYTENEVRQMFAGGQFRETSGDRNRSEVRSLLGSAASKDTVSSHQKNPWKAAGVGEGQYLSLNLGADTKAVFEDFQNRDGHWNAVQIEGMNPAWLDLKEGNLFYRRLSEKMEFLAAYIRFYLPKDVEPRLYEMADEQGWPFFRTEERKLGFVLTEMVKNAIVYGHKLDLTLPVLIHWELDRKRNVFMVRVANKVRKDDSLVRKIGAGNIRDILRLGGEGRAEAMIREMTGGNIPVRSTLKDGTVMAKLEIPVEKRSEIRTDAPLVFEWAGGVQNFDALRAAWEAQGIPALRELPEAKTDKDFWESELAERIEQGRNFIDYKEPDLFEKRKDSEPIVHLEPVLQSDEVGFLKTFYHLTGKDEESISLRREGPLFVLEYQKIYHAGSPASSRYITRLNFGTHGLRIHVQADDRNTRLSPVSGDLVDQWIPWQDIGLPDGYLPGVRFYGDGSFGLVLDPAVIAKLENLTVPFVRFVSRSEVRNQEAVQAEIDRATVLKNGARMRARQFLKYNRDLIQWFLALKDARTRNTEEAKEEQALILETMRGYADTLKEIARQIRPDAGEGMDGERARYTALDDYAVKTPAGISQTEVTVALTAESRKLKEEITAVQKKFLEAHRDGNMEMLRQLNAQAAALYKARLKAQLLQASSYLLEPRIDEMALLTVLTAIRIGYLKLSHEYGWRVRRALQEAAIRKIQVVGREGDVAQVYDYENFKMATAPDENGKQDPVTIFQDVWVRKELEDGTVTYQPQKREFVFKDLATAVRRSFHILLNQEVDFAQVYDRINDLDYGIDLLRTSGDVLPDYVLEDIRESVDFIMNGRHGGLEKGRVDEKGNAASNIRTAMAELDARHTEKAVEMFEAAKKELESRLETLVGKKSGISSQAQYLIHQYRRQETARAMRELVTLVENGEFAAGYQLLRILYKTHYLHKASEDSQYASLQWHVIDLGTSLKRLAANKERLSVVSQENALRYVNDTIRRIQTMAGTIRQERSEMRSPDSKGERPGHHELAISHIAGWRIRSLVRGIFEMIEAHPLLAALPWSVVRNGDHHVSMSLHKSKDHPSISFSVGTKWLFWVSVETVIRMNGNDLFRASFWGSSRYVLSSTSKKFEEWFEKMPLPPSDPAAGRSEMRSGLPLKAVVFDIGNVIFDIDFSKMALAFRALGGRVGSTEGIINFAINSELYSAFERDEITPKVYLESLCGMLGVGVLSTDRFADIFSDIFTLKPETVELIGQARKTGAKIFFLSDTNRFHIDHLRTRYPEVFKLADHVFTSYGLRTRKGDGPKIFRGLGDQLRRDYGLKPKDVIFFDDLKWNIEMAQKAGFPAALFTSAQAARETLVRRDPFFIDNADDLANYIHKLASGISRNVPEDGKVTLPAVIAEPNRYSKEFYKPLYELFLARLSIDFDGLDEFISHARSVLKTKGVRGLRKAMSAKDPGSSGLLTYFQKIRVGENTPEALVEFYGQLLFFLTSRMEDYLGPIYDAVLSTRPEIAIARKGKSYHTRAESTTRIADKGILYGKTEAVDFYRQVYDNLFDKTDVKTRSDSDHARKVLKALRYWEERAGQPGYEILKKRIENFKQHAVVLEYDSNLPLVVADTEKNIFRVVHTERLTNAFYFSSAYLDSLDMENPEDMKELAIWLNFGQEWLDIYRDIYGDRADEKIEAAVERGDMITRDYKKGNAPEALIAEAIEEERARLNLYFFSAGEDSHLIPTEILQERMMKRMRGHVLQRYQEFMPEIFREEEEADALLRVGEKDWDRFAFAEAKNIYERLLHRCEAMGMHTDVGRLFNKFVYATDGVQLYDIGGLLPHHLQMQLVLVAIRFRRWDVFLNELEILLKGRAAPERGLDREILKGRLRQGYPLRMSQPNVDMVINLLGTHPRTSFYARKLRSAMAAQLSATPPDFFEKAEGFAERANQMLEEFFRAPFANLKPEDFAPVPNGEIRPLRSEIRSGLPADFSENIRQQLMKAIAHFSQTIDQSSESQVKAMEQFIVNNLEKFSDDKDISKLMDVLFEIWIRYSKITRVPSEVYASRIRLLFGNVFTLMRIVEEDMHRNDIALFEKYVGVASLSDRGTLKALLEEVWTRMPEIESKELEPFIEFELLEAREKMSATIRQKLADWSRPSSEEYPAASRSEMRDEKTSGEATEMTPDTGAEDLSNASEVNAWFKTKYEQLRNKSSDFRLLAFLLKKADLSKGHKFVYLLLGVLFGLSAPPVEISKAVVIPAAALLTIVSPALIVVPIILSLWMGSILRLIFILLPVWGFTKGFFRKPIRVKALLQWNFVPFAGAYGAVIGQLLAILGERYRNYNGISFWAIRNLNRVISRRLEPGKTALSQDMLGRLNLLSPEIAFHVLDFQYLHHEDWKGEYMKVRKASLDDPGLQKKMERLSPTLFIGADSEYEALRQRILSRVESGKLLKVQSEQFKQWEKKIEKNIRKRVKSRIEGGFSKATQEKFQKQIRALVDQEVHQQIRERIHDRLRRSVWQKAKELPFYRFDVEAYLAHSDSTRSAAEKFFVPLFGDYPGFFHRSGSGSPFVAGPRSEMRTPEAGRTDPDEKTTRQELMADGMKFVESAAPDGMAQMMPFTKEFLRQKIEKTQGKNFYVDVTKIPLTGTDAILWVCQPPYGGNFILIEYGGPKRSYTLIDAGLGCYYRDTLQWLRDRGINPYAIEQIVMSHAHPDHNGAAGYWQEEFPHIRIVAHPQWEKTFDASDPLRKEALKFLSTLSDAKRPREVLSADTSALFKTHIGSKAFDVVGKIKAGELEFQVISFPAHTPDSVLLVEFSEKLVIAGEPLVAPDLVMDKDRFEFILESVRLYWEYGVHALGDMVFFRDNLRLKRQSGHRIEIYGHGRPQRRNHDGVFESLPQVRIQGGKHSEEASRSELREELSPEILNQLPSLGVGPRIALIREFLGLKKADVAKAAGVPSSTYVTLERNPQLPHPRYLYAIAVNGLHVDPMLLIAGRYYREARKDWNVHERMRFLRIAQGKNQEQMAEVFEKEGLRFDSTNLDSKRGSVVYWENKTLPQPEKRPVIAKVLEDPELFDALPFGDYRAPNPVSKLRERKDIPVAAPVSQEAQSTVQVVPEAPPSIVQPASLPAFVPETPSIVAVSVPEIPASVQPLVATTPEVEPASSPAGVMRDEALAAAIAEAERKQQADKKARADRRLKGWRIYFEESVQGPRTFEELSGRAAKALYRAGIYYKQQFENSAKSGYAIMDAIESLTGVGEAVKREVFAFLRHQGRFSGVYQELKAAEAPETAAKALKTVKVKAEVKEEAVASQADDMPVEKPAPVLIQEIKSAATAAAVVPETPISTPEQASPSSKSEEKTVPAARESTSGSSNQPMAAIAPQEVPDPAIGSQKKEISEKAAGTPSSSESVPSAENAVSASKRPTVSAPSQKVSRAKNSVAFFVNVKKSPSTAEDLENFLSDKEKRKTLPALLSFELLGVDLYELVFDRDKASLRDPVTLLLEILKPDPDEVEVERLETMGMRVIKFIEKESEETFPDEPVEPAEDGTGSDQSEFDEEQQSAFVREALDQLGLTDKEIKALDLPRIYQLYDRQENEALEDYFLEQDLNEIAERLDDFILRMDEAIDQFTEELDENEDSPSRSELRSQQVYTGMLRAVLRQQPADQNVILEFTKEVETIGVEPAVKGLWSAFNDILLPEAMASIADRGAESQVAGYRTLENLLRDRAMPRERFNALADRMFERSLSDLSEAIRNREVEGMAPVVFYAPEIKERLIRFIETVQQGFERTGDVTGENYRISIVSANRTDLAALKMELSKRGAVHGIKFIENSKTNTALAQLVSSVIRHPVFGEKFGVFFPEYDLGQGVAWQRVVRSEIPKEYSIVLLPALSRYFSTVSTSQINATTLRQALPDLVASAAFRVGQGIAIVAAFLEHLAAAEKQIAASA